MFENIRFDGTFRTYQQKILDGAEKYLEDGKINVVAAPGSGKTVLGLELIRRLGKPCLILSPTTTIREQWGERFTRGFVCVGDTGAADIGATDTGAEGLAALVSTDLKAPKPITSVTYQALYSAAARVKCTSDGEEVDNSSVDIYRVIEEYGIGTLCLDEAHHLQNEWQKALEEFIKKIGGRCTVISLTATPPYDASPAEWKRYISVCGEIDEEIFVPELVKSGTLCPHQDYIYFSYPDGDELRALESFNSDVKSAVDEVKACAALKSVCANLTYTYADLNGWIDDGFSQLQCVVLLLRECGLAADKRLEKELNINKYLFCDLMKIQTALNFIIAEEKLIFEREREEIVEIFKKRGLWERGKITLEKSDKLTRARNFERRALYHFRQIGKVCFGNAFYRVLYNPRSRNADVDNGTAFSHAVEGARHKRVILYRVAENDKLCTAEAVSVRRFLRGLLYDFTHKANRVHIYARL